MIGRWQAGMSTIEALVSVALLGLIGSSLMHSLAQAMSIRAISSRHLQAAEQAMSTVERLRSGDRALPPPRDGFESDWQVQPLAEPAGLARFSVTLRWQESGPRQLTLEGLMWSPP